MKKVKLLMVKHEERGEHAVFIFREEEEKFLMYTKHDGFELHTFKDYNDHISNYDSNYDVIGDWMEIYKNSGYAVMTRNI